MAERPLLHGQSRQRRFDRNIAAACGFARCDKVIVSHESAPVIPPVLAEVIARLDQKAQAA